MALTLPADVKKLLNEACAEARPVRLAGESNARYILDHADTLPTDVVENARIVLCDRSKRPRDAAEATARYILDHADNHPPVVVANARIVLPAEAES